MPLILTGVAFVSTNASAASSCEVPNNNSWDIMESINIHTVEDGGIPLFGNFFDYSEKSAATLVTPLTKDFSYDVNIGNDSATAISMQLVKGYKYNFCITFSPSLDENTTIANGDIYLMTESNWETYTSEYSSRSYWNGEEGLAEIPVEWRDMMTWLPFRDVHAYEGKNYDEFSVGIDASGSSWSSLIGGKDSPITYYLVLDGWDNSRGTDTGAIGNSMNAEIRVDVEERIAIPNFTAYLVIGALPLSCIVVPMILHMAYKNAANEDNKKESYQQIPLLEEV